MAMNALLELRNIRHAYGQQRVVNDLSLTLKKGAIGCLLGPSGCGKTTVLRCIAGFESVSAGAILLNGVMISNASFCLPPEQRHIGMVFQRPTPFPTMSIRDNVAAGLRIKFGSVPPRKEMDEIVQSALVRAGLWDEVKDRLRESAIGISGGQQQRLCIARALATRPEVLLLDEPTASLDPMSTQTIEELVYELRQSIAVVIVTHNMQQAARVSDSTAFMLAGELVEVAPTRALFTRPNDSRTEAYVTGRFG